MGHQGVHKNLPLALIKVHLKSLLNICPHFIQVHFNIILPPYIVYNFIESSVDQLEFIVYSLPCGVQVFAL